ncbi:unnamed protein product [Dibothriocephalus latus]|uniref:MKRN2 opposite strand protein-like C-terminal domain-containing protein n=1 Tax=Dibothriocephalus latus TaxID=60516 RepID=A0A3P7PZE4_DIBLA|nr:unnamed protein product [Dibothriocephalus latus]
MLCPVYAFKTRCCSGDDDPEERPWQYTLNKAKIICQNCGSGCMGADFVCPPSLLPFPLQNPHCAHQLRQSPVRLAFLPANVSTGGGFFKYRLGDGLHCGVVDTAGVVHSYVPSKGFRSEASSWEQSILVVISDSEGVSDERWELSIQKCMDDAKTKQMSVADAQRAALLAYYHGESSRKKKSDYDCLDFAVCVVNHAFETDFYTRERISELMCCQLKSVLLYADCQRSAAAFCL